MFKVNPVLLTDAYKISHPVQYPENTEYVYSNITPRSSRLPGVNQVVVFGLQYFIKRYLMDEFDENFFNRPKDEVLAELTEFFDDFFGPGAIDVTRYGDLHDLGYLPLTIKALPEGVKCPVGVPFSTIVNTKPEFYWLTNAVETLSQCTIWNPLVAGTISNRSRETLDQFAQETSSQEQMTAFQAHNFSMRGMSSVESAITTDLGHLLSSLGTDTLPGTVAAKYFYGADPKKGLIGCSIPATEHAVMCAGGMENELETFRRLITETYPSGLLSIVSDTWDLWKVLTEVAPALKEEILARDGKIVFRPDSGDPVLIMTGYFVKNINATSEAILENPNTLMKFVERHSDELFDAVATEDGKYFDLNQVELSEHEIKGVIALLEETFGSTKNDKGFYELNEKVGAIYGDSINHNRMTQILQRLKLKGYASTNAVFGVGSFTYQYNTRDTFGVACKATSCVIDGKRYAIFKDPVTDAKKGGSKKSAAGLLRVDKVEFSHGKSYVLKEDVSPEEEAGGCLEVVFQDGKLIVDHKWEDIKARLR